MTIEIRPLTADDRAAWDVLWAGYLAFYEHDLAAGVTDQTWRRFLDPVEPMGALGAFDGADLVGFCHHVFHRSSWSPTTYLYLEDLFAAPDARGQGVGRALIAATEAVAVHAGATQIYWQTEIDNLTARSLYDQVAEHKGHIIYEKDLEPPAP